MQASISIGGQEIKAGSRVTIHLALPDFYTHSRTTMPVHVVRGRQAGPSVMVTSALHGDELNGLEIIRRLLGYNALARIKGTLLLVPVVNVFGFVSQSRYLPDRRDLNRSFPGSPKGSMAARLANTIMTELLPACTQVIDLHTGAVGRENLPQIRAAFNGNEELYNMATAFKAPVILEASLREGTFRQAAQKAGTPTLVYEAGEALRFDEVSIRAGVTGILNVLAHLGMIRKRTGKRTHVPVIAKSSSWVRAPQSGILRSLAALGTHVAEGETIAYINDPIGEHTEEVRSATAGIVIGRARIPLVHEGEAIFHVARFSQTDEAAESIEIFQDAFDPLTGTSDSDEPPLVG